MKNLFLLLLTIVGTINIYCQDRTLEIESKIETKHETTANGIKFPYTATTGTQPVWDEDGKVIASLFYTYYKRSDIKNDEERPIIISFNGGPGSASVWMHIAYTGPKILNIDNEGYPLQPYGIKTNPYSILDVADILYVNPVNTGYSRMIKDAEGIYPDKKLFFGINADIKYLSEWINTFITRNNRWRSPKYLIGESYGGIRVAGLSLALQEKQWMYINGVIMVSPADYNFLYREGPVPSAINVPYYTAAAWHHKTLSSDLLNKDLLEVLPEVEKFTINELLPALFKGGFLDKDHQRNLAKKMSYYTSIPEQVILDNNLDISTSFFWKELKRNKGYTIGRLDSRYLGIDKKDSGIAPDYSPELSSWLHSFTPAMNYYVREHLNYVTDIKYEMLSPSVHPWDRTNDNTRDNLRAAMAQNPYLNVMFQSGYYDGATTYFGAKYTMWQLDPSGKMKDRLEFHGYKSGHMMYLRKEDLELSNQHIRDFIKKSTPKKDQAAKY